ncbi:hypothetical protein V6N11_043817 [Hibiscus sabdariffa]|uniref:Uncharacterized protein n=1 Tax=Hibiscus sabdariffa TaxID=183260 RepID=A0ABR2RDP6_9ROSI
MEPTTLATNQLIKAPDDGIIIVVQPLFYSFISQKLLKFLRSTKHYHKTKRETRQHEQSLSNASLSGFRLLSRNLDLTLHIESCLYSTFVSEIEFQ